MNYQKVYNQIIESAKSRGLNKKLLEGYFEKHHIIPRCLKGSNEKCNLVLLTAREHYLCHWLLWKSNKENGSLFLAYHKMVYQKRAYQERNFKIGSRQYEILKSERSNRMKGENNHFYGKRHSEDVYKQISQTWKSKMNNGYVSHSKGKPLTKEHKLNCSKAQKLRYELVPKVIYIPKGPHDFSGELNPRSIFVKHAKNLICIIAKL